MKKTIYILAATTMLLLGSSKLQAQCSMGNLGQQSSLGVSLDIVGHGQSFIPTCSGTLTAITLSMSSSSSFQGNITIYAGSGNGGAVIYNQPIAIANVAGYNRIDLPSPPMITAGNVYTFVITNSNGNAAPVQMNGTDGVSFGSDSYVNGVKYLVFPGGSAIVQSATWDLLFQVDIAPPPCTPTTSTTNVSITSGGSYSFNGSNYSAAGTYVAHLTNTGGCDSTATLNLTVLPTNCSMGNLGQRTSLATNLNVVGHGQSFIPTCTGAITAITLRMSSSSSFQGNMTIYTGSGNGGAVIYNQPIAISNVAGNNRIALPSPPVVTAGNVYTFVITNSDGNANAPAVRIEGTDGVSFGSDSYVDGVKYLVFPGGSSIVQSATWDLLFQVDIAPPCTPTTSTRNISICSGSAYAFNGISYNTAGTYTATLTNAKGCDSIATLNLTVKTSPPVTQLSDGRTIITTVTLCTIGQINTYYTSYSNGIWKSSNPSVADVGCNGSRVSISAYSNGTATMSSKVIASNGCESKISIDVTVAPQAAPNAITGNDNVCIGATTALSSTTPGGVWSSTTSYRGTINASGIYTGTSAGTGEVRYYLVNAAGCNAFVNKIITTNALPSVPNINYAPGTQNPQVSAGVYCANRTFTLVGTPSGGMWAKTGALTVNALTGTVNTGSSGGSGSIIYIYTNANGCSNSRTITGFVANCASRGVNGANNGQLTMDNQQWSMYPNPAKTFIRLNVEALIGTGTIVVTDLYGKQVKTQTLSMGTNTIDVSSMAKGIYFVSTITNEGKTTKKLVVE